MGGSTHLTRPPTNTIWSSIGSYAAAAPAGGSIGPPTMFSGLQAGGSVLKSRAYRPDPSSSRARSRTGSSKSLPSDAAAGAGGATAERSDQVGGSSSVRAYIVELWES